MSGGYDLDAHDPKPMAEEGVEMQLLDPRRRPTKVTLRVRGMDSESYNAVLEAQLRRRKERMHVKVSADEEIARADAEFYELHAALIAAWPAGAFRRKGETFDYSPTNAADLLRQYPYILEQVMAFARERVNFLPGSASS